jgi:hypothetical protein
MQQLQVDKRVQHPVKKLGRIQHINILAISYEVQFYFNGLSCLSGLLYFGVELRRRKRLQ